MVSNNVPIHFVLPFIIVEEKLCNKPGVAFEKLGIFLYGKVSGRYKYSEFLKLLLYEIVPEGYELL
jgi:hypothetical protein